MKHILLSIVLVGFTLTNFFCCKAQGNVIELTSNEDLNYYLSNVAEINANSYSLFSGTIFINIFTVRDSKATPDNYFEGYDSVLQSVLITINPDGDYYTKSKLFKIEGLEAPKLIAITEQQYPNFEIIVESGAFNERTTKSFIFQANFD